MMARKAGGRGVIYEVREDPHQLGKWLVQRGGVGTGGFAFDKDTAIGLAYAAASREAHDTKQKVRVVSIVGGKRQIEWSSP